MLKQPVIKEVQLQYIINKSVFIAIIAVVLGAASAQTASTPSFRDQLNTAFGAKAVGKIAEIGVTHLQVPPQAGLALLGRTVR
jgi:hypothetical protein